MRLVALMLRGEDSLLSRSRTVRAVGGNGSIGQVVSRFQGGVLRFILDRWKELVSRFKG